MTEFPEEPSFRDSVGDRPSEDRPVGDFCPPCAAAAAAACARSFREAFPLFFRSRMYSQPSPNSKAHRSQLRTLLVSSLQQAT